MTILHFIEAAAIAGLIMGVIDGVWLGTVAKKFYYEKLGHLLRDKPDMVPAILFYIIYIVGLTYLAIAPALDAGSIGTAAFRGGVVGLLAYSTYDLTNASTIKHWSCSVTIVDMIWGTVLSAVVATLTYLAMQLFI